MCIQVYYMKISDVVKEADVEGDNREARSFELLISTIDNLDEDMKDLIKDYPSMITLMRAFHKAGFWAGAEYSRYIYNKLRDNINKLVDDIPNDSND